MDKQKLQSLQVELISLCTEVAAFIRSQLDSVQASDVEEKELNSLVSYVDKEAENKIVEKLSILTPEAGFITEEDTEDSADEEYVWIIDPLDGTTNFLKKIPHFSISIALKKDKHIIQGIVYEVMLDIAYTAIKGEGAFMNGRPIKVTGQDKMNHAVVVTGFPYKKDFDIDASLSMLKYCVINCRGVRRLGSAALDLAYVAAGKIDAYYENSLNIWDVAAGALLVEEAGGIMTDYEGTKNYLNRGSILASTPDLYENLSAAIQEHLT